MPERFEDRAYILHKRAYKESSYIIDLFTRQHGVVSVIAKGAKSNKSKFYLNLQLFSCLDVMFTGKSELMTLTQAEVSRATRITDQEKVFCGYYVNELVLRLLHKHDQHQYLFDCYDELIVALAGESAAEPLLRDFEKTLLSEIGYGVDFSSTAAGATIQDNEYYMVTLEEGVLPAAAHNTSALQVRGKTLNDFSNADFSDEITLRELKRLMRYILQYYLGNKPLKTRDLFAKNLG